MNRDKWLKIGGSLLVAFIVAKLYIGGLQDKLNNQYSMTNAVCAAQNIQAGTILLASHLIDVPIANRFIQPTGLVSKLPRQGFEQAIGKQALIVIPSGAQILPSMLGRAQTTAIEFVIPPGKRAYPLVLSRMEITRLISAGSRIDVIANLSIRSQEGNVQHISKTVLEDILVLSVRDEVMNQIVQKETKNKVSEGIVLTLAVSPKQAEELSWAEKNSQGDFRVVIRPAMDVR